MRRRLPEICASLRTGMISEGRDNMVSSLVHECVSLPMLVILLIYFWYLLIHIFIYVIPKDDSLDGVLIGRDISV